MLVNGSLRRRFNQREMTLVDDDFVTISLLEGELVKQYILYIARLKVCKVVNKFLKQKQQKEKELHTK